MRPMLRTTSGLCGLVLCCSAIGGFAQEKQPGKPTTHMVAMSDGVKLATDVYLPGDGTGQYPVIVARTPYNKNSGPVMAAPAIKRGYAFVIQDLRGRFASEGHHAII